MRYPQKLHAIFQENNNRTPVPVQSSARSCVLTHLKFRVSVSPQASAALAAKQACNRQTTHWRQDLGQTALVLEFRTRGHNMSPYTPNLNIWLDGNYRHGNCQPFARQYCCNTRPCCAELRFFGRQQRSRRLCSGLIYRDYSALGRGSPNCLIAFLSLVRLRTMEKVNVDCRSAAYARLHVSDKMITISRVFAIAGTAS
jgi:hypothetical protein